MLVSVTHFFFWLRNLLTSCTTSLHKKWSFPIRISSVNVTKSAGSCGFGHIHWRNPYWKTFIFFKSSCTRGVFRTHSKPTMVLLTINYFRKKTPLLIFDWVLNAFLSLSLHVLLAMATKGKYYWWIMMNITFYFLSPLIYYVINQRRLVVRGW